MTNSYLKGFLLTTLALLLTGCGIIGRKDTDNEIRFDSVTVAKTNQKAADSSRLADCSVKVDFVYPIEYNSRKELLPILQQQFITAYFSEDYASYTPAEAADRYMQNYVETFDTEMAEMKAEYMQVGEEPDLYSGYEYSRNDIVYNRNQLVSMVVYKEYYNGGAHGSRVFFNYTFDLNTGRRIVEDEIFVDDYEERLAQVIVESLLAEKNLSRPADLEEAGYFSVDDIYPNKNFYVDGDGVFYTFNEYEIAPYVVGATTVRLPYDKILHLLRRESPIAHLAFK